MSFSTRELIQFDQGEREREGENKTPQNREASSGQNTEIKCVWTIC